MYGFEDMFERLPVHWMWWPALGGLGVGVGGLFFPARPRGRIRQYRGAPPRQCAAGLDRRYPCRQVANVGILTAIIYLTEVV